MDTNTSIYEAYTKGNQDTTRVDESALYDLVCEGTINENGIVTHPYEEMLIGNMSDHNSPETLSEAYNKVHYIPDRLFIKEDQD